MTLAVSKAVEDGARRPSSARRPATPRRRPRPTRRAPACAARSSCPRDGSRSASSPRPRPAAPASCRSTAASTTRPAAVRELCDRHPITLVNNLNPYRLEGQKTAAFEISRSSATRPTGSASRSATAATSPPTGAASARRSTAATPAPAGVCSPARRAGAASLVRGPLDRAPRRSRRRSGSAGRCGVDEALEARVALGGPRRRAHGRQILDGVPPAARRARACSASRPRRRRFAGLVQARARRHDRRGRAGRLRPHRPRAEGSRHRDRQTVAPFAAGASYEAVEAAVLGD